MKYQEISIVLVLDKAIHYNVVLGLDREQEKLEDRNLSIKADKTKQNVPSATPSATR